MNPDIKNLTERIKELEKWKAEKERQQIKFPLDIQSQNILNKYFLSKTKAFDTLASATGFEVSYIVVKQDGNSYVASVLPYLYSFIASTSTDELAVTNVLNPLDVPVFADTQPVRFETTGTLPAPLALGTTYYVKVGGSSFDVASTPGGASINITSTGTGVHYIFQG